MGTLDASPTFSGCTFVGNYAAKGGALYTAGSGSPVFENCRFLQNQAATGAAFYNRDAAPRLVQCLFQGNISGAAGGACLFEGGTPYFSRCTFADNQGGTGGAGTSRSGAVAEFHSCTMVRNGSNFGGHLAAFEGSRITVDHSILAFSTEGGAVRCFQAQVEMECCDVYGNEEGDWTDCIGTQFDGVSNISADPLFCLEEEADYRLRAESPCAPENNQICGQIGAWPAGCSPSQVALTARPSERTLRLEPNPARSGEPIKLSGIPAEARSIEIYNVVGRMVRRIEGRGTTEGTLSWDGRDESGRPVPAGLYPMRCRMRSGSIGGVAVILR